MLIQIIIKLKFFLRLLIQKLNSDRSTRFLITSLLTFIFIVNFSGINLWLKPAPANSEGIHQANSQFGATATGNGLNVYLFETTYANAAFVAPPNDRPVLINAEAGEVINISLCAPTAGNTIDVEVFGPAGTGTASPSGLGFGSEINYNTATLVTAKGGGAVIGGLTNTATAGANFSSIRLTTGNAQVGGAGTICTGNVGAGTNVTYPAGVLTNAIKIVVPAGGAGTYEIRMETSVTGDGASMGYWDFTITPNTATNPDPKSTLGRVWAPAWAFNAGNTFTDANGSYDGNFFVRTPGGRPSTEYIWQLDLTKFAPQRHDIIANGIGLNPPYSRYSAPGPSSAPAASPALGAPPRTRNFPIYLSNPSPVSFLPLLPEPIAPNILGFRFVDSDGQDNTITPNPSTATVQDTGNFEFTTDVDGTYELTIDTNSNGVFGAGDRVFFGSITANALQQVTWNGTNLAGANLPVGTYPVKLQIRIGEYHFVAFDAETSGGTPSGSVGGGNGLTIFKGSGANTQVYWDDNSFLSGQGGLSNLPNGGLSGTADGRHTWGNFAAGSIGDTRFMDTWVFGASQQLLSEAIIADVDTNDFGDAPDTYGTNKANSGTEGVGASQLLSATIKLGTAVTDEELPSKDGQPNPAANGDDIANTDDEDGVSVFNPLRTTDTNYTLPIRVQNTSGANAYLGGWIDFNRNGRFEASEGVVQTIATGTNGNVNINWTGLGGLGLTEGNTYARFRINNDLLTTSDFIGGKRNGEVEDYAFTIIGPTSPLDYGDAPDASIGVAAGNYNTTNADNGASHLISTNLRLGANTPDADTGLLQNAAADADDITNTGVADDEDGVTLPNTLTTFSTTYSATVNVTNSIGTPATLVGWIDFNKNGVFEAGEAQTATVADNSNGTNVVLNWTGLSGLTVGNTYSRFRISNGLLTTSTPTGLIGTGEVEDYLVTINTLDYGDAPDATAAVATGNYQTTAANGGASHIIVSTLKIGAATDADSGTLQNANADLDDTTGIDDEDGVILPAITASTTTYTATVNVTNTAAPAYLVGWIDFNRNGLFEVAEGRAFDSDLGTAGVQPIAISPTAQNLPLQWTGISGLTTGDILYAHFRLSDSATLTTATPNGAIGSGEVEDYQIIVANVGVPGLNLVKRITAINNTPIAGFVDGPNTATSNDNDPNWPTANTQYLRGAIDCTTASPCNGGTVAPRGLIEYTIYFLSNGTNPARNVQLCDQIPANTIFQTDTYGSGNGILLGWNVVGGASPLPDPTNSTIGAGKVALNNIPDADAGQFLPTNVSVTTAPAPCNNGVANPDGALLVRLGTATNVPNATASGSPTNSYGFVRFVVTVN